MGWECGDMLRHYFKFSGFVALMLAAHPLARAQSSQTHSGGRSPQNTTRNITESTEAIATVDAYLNQILCSNVEFKIWKEGLYRASRSPISEALIRKSFSENLYYSLMPGQEQQAFKEVIPKIFASTESITKDLADIAVFFSHTLHELHEAENKRLSERGMATLSKDEFILGFGRGTLELKHPSNGANAKDWVNQKIKSIEASTSRLKYGCAGNRNFIYRANSRLGSVIDLDSFVIPATSVSAKKIYTIADNASNTSPEHERARENAPQAAVLSDDKKETLERAEAIYKPAEQPLSVRSQQMVGATFYFTPIESDARYRGPKNTRIFDENGNVIARVSSTFARALTLQGSGILSNGKTLNFVRTRNGTPRFKFTNSRYGLGNQSNPLKPWRSVAIDFNYYKNRGINLRVGQKIYIPSTDGLKIPGTNTHHDGVWELADVGGAIKGARIDMFTGTMHWMDALNYVKNSSNYNDRRRNAEASSLGDRRKQVTVKILR
jgi:3D (Asp-Asp-Asp) domain-containing protein